MQAMNSISAKVTQSGRLSIPAEFRRALGLERGGSVIVELEGKEIRIRTVAEVLARSQAIARRALKGKRASVDDFLAWRRREAERE
jgi:AbrB family looped-hinge helix DNA binding protein